MTASFLVGVIIGQFDTPRAKPRFIHLPPSFFSEFEVKPFSKLSGWSSGSSLRS
jgi:hypothetical protein